MNTDSEIPAAKAENDCTPSGLNHCGSMDSPAGAVRPYRPAVLATRDQPLD